MDQVAHRPAAARPAIASIVDLRVHFQSKRGRVHSVDGVNFDIRDGETLGLVGETGCGKSVTGRSFMRLIPMPPGMLAGGSITFRPQMPCPDCGGEGCQSCGGTGRRASICPSCRGAGCAACDGTGAETVDLLKVSPEAMRRLRGDRIAMIFQDPGKALNPTLPVGTQVAEVFLQHRSQELLAAAGLGRPAAPLRRMASQTDGSLDRLLLSLPPLRSSRSRLRAALDDMVADALAETQIPNPRQVMARYPHELSGGMKQRVMIAQALACNPDLLIADEPTTALDVTVQARILELIAELQRRRRTSVLYISHDLSLVRRICDRVAVMYAGQIVEIGETEDLFADPRHPYTRGLLAALPAAGVPRGKLAAIPGTVPELVDPPAMCRFSGRCPHTAGACLSHLPALQPVRPGHSVACFLDHPPPSGEPPRRDGRL
jgi:oligopeptide/dipeptide ABC transporter ATP-binding protein